MVRLMNRAQPSVLALLVLAGGLAHVLAPAPAFGATVTVNTTADGNDFNTADAFCDADPGTPGEQCTLRAAIQQTNAQPGQDTVLVPAGTFTFDNEAGYASSAITDDVVIRGQGSSKTIIRQELAGRVLQVGTGASLDLRDVTVRDGVLAAEGAGIANAGTLILRRVVVRNNQTIGSHGGGIYSTGTATATRILGSTIGTLAEPNIAGGAGLGNVGGRGGGVAVEGGELEIRGSLIEANEANEETGTGVNGGGVYVDTPGGASTIVDSTIRGNRANNRNGGGIAYAGATAAGDSLVIERTTISGNHANTCGGGLLSGGDAPKTVSNSTISGNSADSNGGAVCAFGDHAIVFSTVAGNMAPLGPGLRQFAGTMTLIGTVLDNQDDDNCSDAGGSFASAGGNIDSGDTCGFPAGESNKDPKLGPLANNGGPTRTHALLKGSPAINAGGAGCGGTDQRGAPRQGVCDAGAYERVFCQGVLVNRVGTTGNDKLVGTAGKDGMLGLGGNDRLEGRGGADGLCGGSGNDVLIGGGGNDKLYGQSGRDKLYGNAGRDFLHGGKGRDFCHGGPGRDRAKSCERKKSIP